MMKSLCRALFPLGLFVLFAMVATAENLAQKTPHETVQQATDQLVELIRDSQAKETLNNRAYFSEVTRVLDPFVDFTAIARSVMAVHYKRASESQRADFSASFKSGLVKTYSAALLQFGSGGIKVLEPTVAPRNPKRPTVKMEISTEDGKVYPVQYSMAKHADGTWKMRNVIINGINIGLTLRKQFANSMKEEKNDLDAAIGGWAELIEGEKSTVADKGPAE